MWVHTDLNKRKNKTIDVDDGIRKSPVDNLLSNCFRHESSVAAKSMTEKKDSICTAPCIYMISFTRGAVTLHCRKSGRYHLNHVTKVNQ